MKFQTDWSNLLYFYSYHYIVARTYANFEFFTRLKFNCHGTSQNFVIKITQKKIIK